MLIVAWFLYGDLGAMVEYDDGRKVWTCDETVATEYPDGRVVMSEHHWYGERLSEAEVKAEADRCHSALARPVPMPPEMVVRYRELTKDAPYWGRVVEAEAEDEDGGFDHVDLHSRGER